VKKDLENAKNAGLTNLAVKSFEVWKDANIELKNLCKCCR
jgi:hypothetical protein